MTSREFPHRSSSAKLYSLIYMAKFKTRKPWKMYTSLRYETVVFNLNESAEIMSEFKIGWIFSLLWFPI